MNNLKFIPWLCCVFGFAQFPALLAAIPPQSDEILKNGSFSEWKGKLPVGWEVEIGANNGGSEPASKVSKGDGPSLELSGNAKTLAWNFVSQTIKSKHGETYRLTCQAKANVKREGRQFDNCYIGVLFENSAGKTIGNQLAVIGSDDYQPHSVVFRIPPQSAKTYVAIFLSKSGKLNVKDLKLQRFSAAESFDLLVEEMKNNYSYFEHKKIDFPALVEKFRDKAMVAKNNDDFAEVVADMLAELKDVHTWVVKDGKRFAKFVSSFVPNFNYQVVDGDLTNKKRVGQLAVVGSTSEGFGYVRVATLESVNEQDIVALMKEIESLFQTPGIIVDLRANRGGAEPIASAIASMFADKEYVYARQKFRSGDGFAETEPRRVGPRRQGKTYKGPIVCLIGPGAVSSAEGFAMMMKALDKCTTIGMPTRGASGNPQPVPLPNGLDVYFSRWISLTPDGNPIEDAGVQPDIKVEHDVQLRTDPAYQKAKEILAEKSGK